MLFQRQIPSGNAALLAIAVSIIMSLSTNWAMKTMRTSSLREKRLLLMEYIETNGGTARPISYFGKGVLSDTDIQTVTLNSHLISERALEDIQVFNGITQYVFENVVVTDNLFSRIPKKRKVTSLIFVECHFTRGCISGMRVFPSLDYVELRGGTHDHENLCVPRISVNAVTLRSTPSSGYPFSVICDFDSIDVLKVYVNGKEDIPTESSTQPLYSCQPASVQSLLIISLSKPQVVSPSAPVFTHIMLDACAVGEVHARGFDHTSVMHEYSKANNPPKVYSVKD